LASKWTVASRLCSLREWRRRLPGDERAAATDFERSLIGIDERLGHAGWPGCGFDVGADLASCAMAICGVGYRLVAWPGRARE